MRLDLVLELDEDRHQPDRRSSRINLPLGCEKCHNVRWSKLYIRFYSSVTV